MSESFNQFDNFEQIGELFDEVSNSGVHETILE